MSLDWASVFRYLVSGGVVSLAACGLWYLLAIWQGRSIRRANVPATVLAAPGIGLVSLGVASLLAPGGPAWTPLVMSAALVSVWWALQGKALLP